MNQIEIYENNNYSNNNLKIKTFNNEILQIKQQGLSFNSFNKINKNKNKKIDLFKTILSNRKRLYSLPFRRKDNIFEIYFEELKIIKPFKIREAKLSNKNKLKIMIYLIFILIIWYFILNFIASIAKYYADSISSIIVKPFIMTMFGNYAFSLIRIFISKNRFL